ncbi:hypothetical protein [Roseateles violae]|uniref:Uncharacterized protein n=1 Tax=Roseateles violae TaxID=3058042 RepID=A0ABT8DTJ8_9BURK|nr:hypothetical protein [Pelomonas sp. PFR6]MDN3921517.1 hypothetical protein [Pelomonas sp. PFR6]
MSLIGRLTRPCLCGFAAPHVKRNEGKLPYVHCPDCGMMTTAKNGQQARAILANTRPETGAMPEPPATDQPIIVKTDAPPAPKAATQAQPAAAPTPAAPVKRAGFFDTLLNATNTQ